MKKRYLLIGKSNTISSLSNLFERVDTIGYRRINIKNTDSLFDYTDMWWMQNADAYFIDGTWDSKNPERQYSPYKIENEEYNPRTAYMDFSNKFFIEIAKQFNRPVIVTESATLSRIKLNHMLGWYKKTGPRYYRMGLNHWTYNRTKWCKSQGEDKIKRLIELTRKETKIELNNIYDFKWQNNKDGDILIVPGLEYDPTSSVPIEDFIRNTYFEIKKHTNRKILIKLHPQSKINVQSLVDDEAIIIDKQVQLKELQDRLYCAVLDSSTSIFQLINLGIPTITTEWSFGYPLGNSDISKIENLNYATQEEVFEWYKQMSYTEFPYEDFSSPEILRYIEELINE